MKEAAERREEDDKRVKLDGEHDLITTWIDQNDWMKIDERENQMDIRSI